MEAGVKASVKACKKVYSAQSDYSTGAESHSVKNEGDVTTGGKADLVLPATLGGCVSKLVAGQTSLPTV